MKQFFFRSIASLLLILTIVSCGRNIVIEPIVPRGFTLNSNVDKEQGVNSVFFSLKDSKITVADRESWDLAFYCGENHSRVRLNNTKILMACALDKSEMKKVSLEDTKNLRKDFTFDFQMGGSTLLNFDDTDGDLTKTIFDEVSEDTNKNKVYFVVTNDIVDAKEEWFCVKVDRTGDKYSLQYARIKDLDNIKTIEIQKNKDFNFIFISLTTGKAVEVEPKKDNWDLEYTQGLYKTNMKDMSSVEEDPTKFNPYFMRDLIFVNHLAGISTAELPASMDLNYDVISLEKAKSLSFNKDKDAIANRWRSVFEGINYKQLYVINDGKGNYYKLRFLRMGVKGDGGVRGCPEVEFAKIE